MNFTTKILDWYAQNKRELPWRKTSDPYKIWLSEIILQQTRIDQGTAYYEKFVSHYPTVQDLAKAKEESVLLDWQGLGYYSRARNLHFSAKLVVNEMRGDFPTNYKQLLLLKGVGDYTASAVSSICAGENQAVVDGNVYRLLSRVYGIETPIDIGAGHKEFKALAMELLDNNAPGEFNQAVMDFGSIVCKPKQPLCDNCIFNNSCVALTTNKIEALPVKSKKIKVRKRYFSYLIFRSGNSTIIRKRVEKDIWQHLFEFPLVESISEENRAKDTELFLHEFLKIPFQIEKQSSVIKHVLSHQHLFVQFLIISTKDALEKPDFIRISENNIGDFALPRVIEKFLFEKDIL